MQMQQIAYECEDYKNKAFAFQNAILRIKEQRDKKRQKSRE